jgi:8-oxo-dGTP pyrophosphatase MutT (NUDIX family)
MSTKNGNIVSFDFTKEVRIVATARAIIVKNNQILLTSDDGLSWVTPGGWLDGFETLEQCLIREVYEEVGVKIVVKDLFRITYFTKTYKDDKFNENINKIEHHYMCDMIDDKLPESWTDQDPNGIKYAKFFNLADLKNPSIQIFPEFLRQISF